MIPIPLSWNVERSLIAPVPALFIIDALPSCPPGPSSSSEDERDDLSYSVKQSRRLRAVCESPAVAIAVPGGTVRQGRIPCFVDGSRFVCGGRLDPSRPMAYGFSADTAVSSWHRSGCAGDCCPEELRPVAACAVPETVSPAHETSKPPEMAQPRATTP